jgi:hypothetical protein
MFQQRFQTELGRSRGSIKGNQGRQGKAGTCMDKVMEPTPPQTVDRYHVSTA